MLKKVNKPDIIEAAEAGHVDKVKSLLIDSPKNLEITSRIGNAAIHVAVIQRHFKVVKLLVEQGVDVNFRGNRGMTPLHYAAEAEAIDIANLLIQNEANIEATNDSGETPLQIAADTALAGLPDTRKMFDLLKANGAYYDLRSAIRFNDLERVHEILKQDHEALEKNSSGLGLVSYAVMRDVSPELIELLLCHGADPNAPLAPGHPNPIAIVSNPLVAEVLLRNGANPNAKDSQGLTALQRARRNGLKSLKKVMLDHEAMSLQQKSRKDQRKRRS